MILMIQKKVRVSITHSNENILMHSFFSFEGYIYLNSNTIISSIQQNERMFDV